MNPTGKAGIGMESYCTFPHSRTLFHTSRKCKKVFLAEKGRTEEPPP